MAPSFDGPTRPEHDSFGAIQVPATAYWGAQTQRSLQHFDFPPQERLPIAIVHALAAVKLAAARVNRRHSLPTDLADAIEAAAGEVLRGDLDDHFPLTVWQTGSGTHTNMNVNEVIAGRANEILTGTRGGSNPIHPNDHVNRAQSSNDSFPSAIHIAVQTAITRDLLPALDALHAGIAMHAAAWQDVVKIGRTHLQDAVPLTLGQEFSAHAAQIDRARQALFGAMEGLWELAQGGTAVGTGLNAPAGFAAAITKEIAAITGLPFRPARNAFEAIASRDALVGLQGALGQLAVTLTKLAGDIRLMASGPRAGLGELLLPENEPGSSIMPGKVNPSQCEMLIMVSLQVIANGQAVTLGALQGQFELNPAMPLIGANVLRSVTLLARAISSFNRHALDGLRANEPRIAELVERSLMLVTALAPHIGYDNAAKIAHDAHTHGSTLREAALASGLVDANLFDRVVQPVSMARPHG